MSSAIESSGSTAGVLAPLISRAFDQLIVRIVGRPQGVYWVGDDGESEFGPFGSLDDALIDMATAEPARFAV